MVSCLAGVMFSSEQGDASAVEYVDSYYIGDMDDRRSMTGYAFISAEVPIYWKSSVQSIEVMSTNEVDYLSQGESAKEALWLTRLVRELRVEQDEVWLYYVNQSVIYLTNNQVYHAKTKYIDVRLPKIRVLLISRQILLEKGSYFKECILYVNQVSQQWQVKTLLGFVTCFSLLNRRCNSLVAMMNHRVRSLHRVLIFIKVKIVEYDSY